MQAALAAGPGCPTRSMVPGARGQAGKHIGADAPMPELKDQLTRRHDLLHIDIAPPDLNVYEVNDHDPE